MNINDATDAQLVAELVRRNGRAQAPTSMTNDGGYDIVTIADGKDHTVAILLMQDGPISTTLPF